MSPPSRADLEKLLGERQWLARLARRLLGDGPDADDLTQETFARALQAGTVPAQPRRWLGVVARNLRLESRRGDARRRAREEQVARPEAGPEDDALQRASLRHRLLEHVLELPEPERTALVLRYLEGHSYQEIATRQGASLAAVRKRVSRAIDRLRDRLDRRSGGRDAWAGLLAPLAGLRSARLPAGATAAPTPLVLGVLAMSTQLKLVLGGGVLAALVVLLVTRFGPLQPEVGAGPAQPVDTRSPEHVTAQPDDDLDESTADAAGDTARAQAGAAAQGALADERLSGLVLDHLGAPLPGAQVRVSTPSKTDYSVLDIVYGRESRVIGESSTDQEGRFQLAVEPHRPLDLGVHAAGFARAALRAYGGEDVVVRMELEAVVEGRVTRASDGLPLEGIWVRGWTHRPHTVHLFDGHTDRSGSFRFGGLPAGAITMALVSEELADPAWTDIELEPGLIVRRDFALERGVVLSGRVTDAETGEPLVGAEVGPGWTLRTSVPTDQDGRFALPGFGGWGIYDIHVRAPGYGRASHEYDWQAMPQEDTQLDFALQRARGAVGRIVGPGDSPREHVYVAGVGMGGQSGEWEGTRTGADGRFALTSLVPHARHQLFVQEAGFGTLVIDFPPDELSQPQVDFGDVHLPLAAHLSGHVVDEQGQPRPSADVLLRGRHTGAGRFYPEDQAGLSHHMTRARKARADGQGRFHFTDLAPGTYTVVATVPSGSQEGAVQVTVSEGQAVADVELTLPVGLSISGVVVASTGGPCSEVSIAAHLANRGGRAARVKTDEQGRFEVIGLAEGEYVVRARTGLYNAAHPEAPLFERSTTVPAGSEGLLITLQRRVELSGQVRSSEDEVVTNVVVLASDCVSGDRFGSARVDGEGSFTLEVPEGTLVDLETRESRGEQHGYHERDERSVVMLGVEPGGDPVVLIANDY